MKRTFDYIDGWISKANRFSKSGRVTSSNQSQQPNGVGGAKPRG
jgi:hypothetical protein